MGNRDKEDTIKQQVAAEIERLQAAHVSNKGPLTVQMASYNAARILWDGKRIGRLHWRGKAGRVESLFTCSAEVLALATLFAQLNGEHTLEDTLVARVHFVLDQNP